MSTPSSDKTFLRIRNLRMFFPDPSGHGRREALHIRNLDISKGEFFAITGPSGSGKSTFINIVAGFLAPSEGYVLQNGHPVAGSGPDRIVVFQNHALFPWLTAFENVAYGLKRLPIPRTELDRRVREALEMTALLDFANAYPSTLSGGMCQRVALARALVLRPEILLLDEPFASLDAANRLNLQNELLNLWETFGWTVVLVTHRIEEAVCMADRVAMFFPPPSGLQLVTDISLPRPRLSRSGAVVELTEQLTHRLDNLPPSLSSTGVA